jgi:hypothetical protein
MSPGSIVPRWLGFSWWWLLGFCVLANLCSGHLAPISLVLNIGLALWPVVQAGWLRKAFATSRAVYWIVASVVLALFIDFWVPGDLLGGSWWETTITLLVVCCYIAGVCFFVGDLKEYIEELETYHPQLSYVWAILFSTFYFQYKLHEIYEDQLLVSSRLMP